MLVHWRLAYALVGAFLYSTCYFSGGTFLTSVFLWELVKMLTYAGKDQRSVGPYRLEIRTGGLASSSPRLYHNATAPPNHKLRLNNHSIDSRLLVLDFC